MFRCDLAAEEGDEVAPRQNSAAGPSFGWYPHAAPTPARPAARTWQRLHDRAARLHALELEGESATTPAILLAEVVLVLIRRLRGVWRGAAAF